MSRKPSLIAVRKIELKQGRVQHVPSTIDAGSTGEQNAVCVSEHSCMFFSHGENKLHDNTAGSKSLMQTAHLVSLDAGMHKTKRATLNMMGNVEATFCFHHQRILNLAVVSGIIGNAELIASMISLFLDE